MLAAHRLTMVSLIALVACLAQTLSASPTLAARGHLPSVRSHPQDVARPSTPMTWDDFRWVQDESPAERTNLLEHLPMPELHLIWRCAIPWLDARCR